MIDHYFGTFKGLAYMKCHTKATYLKLAFHHDMKCTISSMGCYSLSGHCEKML